MVHEKTPLTSPLEYWHYLDRPETFVRYATESDMLCHELLIIAAVLGSQTMKWGGCSRYCDSGSLKIWYDLRYIVPAYPTVLMEAGQKYVKGKPCKPYNSALGEFFRVSPGLIGVRWALLTYAGSATGKSQTTLPQYQRPPKSRNSHLQTPYSLLQIPKATLQKPSESPS
jgi:hypothetical protein